MVNLGIVDGQSSSSDDEARESLESYRSSPFALRPFLKYAKYQYHTYVWDDDESDDECSTSTGTMQQRFLESLRDSSGVANSFGGRLEGTPVDTYEAFLKHDALVRKKLEDDQRRMLSALEERHRVSTFRALRRQR